MITSLLDAVGCAQIVALYVFVSCMPVSYSLHRVSNTVTILEFFKPLKFSYDMLPRFLA